MSNFLPFSKCKLAAFCLAATFSAAFAQVTNPTPPPSVPKASAPQPPPLQPFDFSGSKRENIQIYLLMGQSNMVGRDTSTIGSQSLNPRIGFLDPSNHWMIAREPMHAGGTGIGPGISFSEEMLKANPGQIICLVPCAVGGTPLRRWVKGGDLYQHAIARAKEAMKTGVIKGVLWHQGESDSNTAADATTYETRLKEMLINLRADLGMPDLPIVVGQLGTFFTGPQMKTVQAAIAHLPSDLPRVGYADSMGLEHKGDHLHFSAPAQVEFGHRYAASMRAIQCEK